MKIRRTFSIPATDAPPGHFDGKVGRRDLGPIEAPAGTTGVVTFEAGSRTNWHRHADGQLLVVVDGQGLVATRAGEPVVIEHGDVVIAGPGEEHWHGASENGAMTHVAFSFGAIEWLEPVVDGE